MNDNGDIRNINNLDVTQKTYTMWRYNCHK